MQADCSTDASLADETGIRAIALFDNEEVGSDSANGACVRGVQVCVQRSTVYLRTNVNANRDRQPKYT